MINHRLAPIHLPAEQFLTEFDLLRQKRLVAKAVGDMDLANGLKVAINSVFGNTKSPYSWLCDPTVLVSTTLLGQLTLLSFIDILADIDGVVLLSANTDGLTIKLHRDLVEWVKAKMNRAAAGVSLSLSWQEYRLIARKDVSNYLAVTPEGKVKAKGRRRRPCIGKARSAARTSNPSTLVSRRFNCETRSTPRGGTSCPSSPHS